MLSLLDGAGATTPIAESARRFRALVSPYTGLVRGAEQTLAGRDDGQLIHVECVTADCAALIGVPGVVKGGGSGVSYDAALAAAVGEAVERYSTGWTDSAEPVLDTAAGLGDEAVSPERFALFSERQYEQAGFPFRPFTAATPICWVRGLALPSCEPAWLPAQLVYMPWRLRPGETPIGRATSNGLAAHTTVAEASLTALLELLERDAFMIAWGARLS
ncbi:MAG: YcaO-like family protein, partial [Gaiellaceae bacterium]